MARGFSQTLLNEPKCAFVPMSGLKMIGDRFRKIDHDAEHRPIDCGTDCNRGHGSSLGSNGTYVDTAMPESGLHETGEAAR